MFAFDRLQVLKECKTKFDGDDDKIIFDVCTEEETEYTEELLTSAVTSLVFTVGMVCYTIFLILRGKMHKRPIAVRSMTGTRIPKILLIR